jgi:hypothetical protein
MAAQGLERCQGELDWVDAVALVRAMNAGTAKHVFLWPAAVCRTKGLPCSVVGLSHDAAGRKHNSWKG